VSTSDLCLQLSYRNTCEAEEVIMMSTTGRTRMAPASWRAARAESRTDESNKDSRLGSRGEMKMGRSKGRQRYALGEGNTRTAGWIGWKPARRRIAGRFEEGSVQCNAQVTATSPSDMVAFCAPDHLPTQNLRGNTTSTLPRAITAVMGSTLEEITFRTRPPRPAPRRHFHLGL